MLCDFCEKQSNYLLVLVNLKTNEEATVHTECAEYMAGPDWENYYYGMVRVLDRRDSLEVRFYRGSEMYMFIDIRGGRTHWFKNGKYHRADGAAIGQEEEWCIEGKTLTKEEFSQLGTTKRIGPDDARFIKYVSCYT